MTKQWYAGGVVVTCRCYTAETATRSLLVSTEWPSCSTPAQPPVNSMCSTATKPVTSASHGFHLCIIQCRVVHQPQMQGVLGTGSAVPLAWCLPGRAWGAWLRTVSAPTRMLRLRVRVQFKQLNDELAVACSALKARVDQTASPDAMLTRTLSATTASPAGGDDAVAAVASYIVEESMAEAAALVHDLFHEQRQKRIAEGAAAAAAPAAAAAGDEAGGKEAAPPVAAGATEPCAAADAAGEPPPSGPQSAVNGATEAAPDCGADAAAGQKNGVVKHEAVAEGARLAIVVAAVGHGDGAATLEAVPSSEPGMKVERAQAAPTEDGAPPPQGGVLGSLDSPQRMALMMDDESLMHMSTKLTAMFIAIQRHAPGVPVNVSLHRLFAPLLGYVPGTCASA